VIITERNESGKHESEARGLKSALEESMKRLREEKNE